MRLQLRLAFALVHEISHALYCFKSKDKSFKPYMEQVAVPSPGRGKKSKAWAEFEPYVYGTYPMPEIGLSWEHHILGGYMCLEWRTLDDFGPVMLRLWEFTWTKLQVNHLVSMRNIRSWFLKSTWENFDTKDHAIHYRACIDVANQVRSLRSASELCRDAPSMFSIKTRKK